MDHRFTAQDLALLQSLTYKRPALVRLLNERCSLDDHFDCYILGLEAPLSIAFDRVMTQFAGDPSAVEFQHKSRDDRWAFVLPDVNAETEGGWRVQYFNLDGFTSHHCEDTKLKAIDSMVSDGFIVPAQGTLDRLCPTPRWKRGVEVAGLIFKLNSRSITYAQFVELVSALEPA